MATELRWDFEQIGRTEWARVTELLNYWHMAPPLSQLANLYLKARGFILKSSVEPTEFEQKVLDKSHKLDLSHVPTHLRDLLQEAQEGKYARRVR